MMMMMMRMLQMLRLLCDGRLSLFGLLDIPHALLDAEIDLRDTGQDLLGESIASLLLARLEKVRRQVEDDVVRGFVCLAATLSLAFFARPAANFPELLFDELLHLGVFVALICLFGEVRVHVAHDFVAAFFSDFSHVYQTACFRFPWIVLIFYYIITLVNLLPMFIIIMVNKAIKYPILLLCLST